MSNCDILGLIIISALLIALPLTMTVFFKAIEHHVEHHT